MSGDSNPAPEKPEKEHLTAEDTEKRWDVRKGGEFCSVPEKAAFIIPTGLVGNDGREIAVEFPWQFALKALSEDIAEMTEGE